MAELNLARLDSKEVVFRKVQDYLGELALTASSSDFARPWGGFFVIDESQTSKFAQLFFPDLSADQIGAEGQKLSPKILVVEPGKRLSWQYHNRRAELWRVLGGPVGVITSPDDEQGPVQSLEPGQKVQFPQEMRHRLIGLDDWGVVAEIWQHTDPQQASDESDIVRVEDDFGR